MEKVFWVMSDSSSKSKDGLEVINTYLEKGWTVKLISACAVGDARYAGQAYIVLEKKDVTT